MDKRSFLLNGIIIFIRVYSNKVQQKQQIIVYLANEKYDIFYSFKKIVFFLFFFIQLIIKLFDYCSDMGGICVKEAKN